MVKLLIDAIISILINNFWINAYSVGSIIITFGVVLIILTIKLIIERIKEEKALNALENYYSYDEIKEFTSNYVTTYFQDDAPFLRAEPSTKQSTKKRQNAIKYFVNEIYKKKKGNNFFLILADSGMGKSTFLINLYLKLLKWIDLFKRYTIEYLPLWDDNIEVEIKNVKNRCNKDTIVLIDALDEDKIQGVDFKKRINQLYRYFSKCRIIIITCRAQACPPNLIKNNFNSDIRAHDGRKIISEKYLSPFSNKDVKKYLNKKFKISEYKKKKKAEQIIVKSPDIMARPLLLSYIDFLLEDNSDFKYSYQVYHQLIKKWIEKDARNIFIEVQKYLEDYEEKTLRLCQDISMEMYKEAQIKHSNDFSISKESLLKLAGNYDIKLQKHILGRSLFNYNADGRFKFAHKSIFEHFLSEEIFRNKELAKTFNFDLMSVAKTHVIERGRCVYIDIFDVYGNIIRSIYVQEIDSIKKLNLKNKFLVTLPNEIGKLKNLESLCLSCNNIEEIPRNVFNLKKLLELDVSNTYIEKIPEKIEKLSNLKMLNMGNCLIKNIPSELFKLNHLEYLDISNNDIYKLSSKISILGNLEYLNLMDTFISILPKEIGALHKLEYLNLSNSGISTIPKEIEGLKKLKVLDLSNLKITEIPEIIFKMKNLIDLNLSKTSISSIPAGIFDCKELDHLDLSNTKISNLPKEIENLTKLKYLNLSNTKISSLPKEIKNLKDIMVLNLSNTKISSLPKEIGDLKKLAALNLSNTKISSLPKEIRKLCYPIRLDISNTQLSNFPKEIGGFHNLLHLDLTNTKIRQLPDTIRNLKVLDKLYLPKSFRQQMNEIKNSINKHVKVKCG